MTQPKSKQSRKQPSASKTKRSTSPAKSAKTTKPKGPTLSEKLKKAREELNSVQEALAEVTSERDSKMEKNIRLLAEFDNYKRRTVEEKSRLVKYASEDFAKSLLPVIDDLQRTVDSIANDNEAMDQQKVLDGILMIQDKFHKTLKDNGIKAFDSVGEAFDPEMHDALMSREDDEYPENTVLEEFEKGYMYHDRIIRHAKVIVSKES